MKKKIFISLITMSILFNLFPLKTHANEEDLSIYANGEVIEKIKIKKDEKIELNVETNKDIDYNFQWQILIEEEIWVDIQGEDTSVLTLSYPLLGNALTNGKTQVRVKGSGQNSTKYSIPVTVKVIEDSLKTKILSKINLNIFSAQKHKSESFKIFDSVKAEENKDMKKPYDNELIKEETILNNDNNLETKDEELENKLEPKEYKIELSENKKEIFDNDNYTNKLEDEVFFGVEGSKQDDYINKKEANKSVDTEVLTEDANNAKDKHLNQSTLSEPPLTTYSIVINYIFGNGQQAANSWTATVAGGSNFLRDVESPSIVGYTPDKETVNLNYNNITKDQTVTVTYNPALVNYKVIHYHQNINDDNYTEYSDETIQGYTQSTVSSELAEEHEGFYSLLYDKTITIAADGSTIVEIYYDRNYYLISFDLNGGYGVEPIYARYGSEINISAPLRTGYLFEGWGQPIPSNIPSGGRSFTANWRAMASTKVTIAVWGENANNNEYSFLTSSETEAVPGEVFTVLEGHTKDCYPGAGNKYVGDPTVHGIKTDGYIGRYDSSSWISPWPNYVKVIFFGGNWYTYTGNKNYQEIVSPNCGEYKLNTNPNTELWIYESSDEIIVAADGSSIVNVFYDRVKFNIDFKSNDKIIYNINEKWGADISRHWPIKGTNGVIYDKGERWNPVNSSNYNQVLLFLSIMPAESFHFTLDRANHKTFYMHYMLEVLPEQNGDIYDGRNFKEEFQVNGNYGYLVPNEDFFHIEGFTQWKSNPKFSSRGRIEYSSTTNGNAYFYYTRNQYDLRFTNYNVELVNEKKTLLYEEKLLDYEFQPTYPNGLEPNAYVFEGWYTSPFFLADTKISFTEDVMPASDVMLYARWTPKQHFVEIYNTNSMTEQIGDQQTIVHGNKAAKPLKPTNGEYTFVGWFYMEGNTEKAFDFSMPVRKDLKLYAKWSSNVLMEYTIHYKLGDTNIDIASPTTGSTLAGNTKTFSAKAGTELGDGYQTGHFPRTNSHSLTLDIADPTKNEFIFRYDKKEKVKYTVRYLEYGTNKALLDDKIESTNLAILTETFAAIEGYMPDDYQKRLVLSSDSSQNIITFWYEKNTTKAPVLVNHYIQNVVGDGYIIYQTMTDLNGIIGEDYSIDTLSIAGFKYKKSKVNDKDTDLNGNKLNGIVSTSGLKLEIYYDRIEYPYEFRYVLQGTETKLAESLKGEARYQHQLTQNAKVIPGYTVQGEPQAMTIQIETGDTPVKNVRTFFYTENEVTIDYKVVGPHGADDIGTLNRNSEKVPVLSGVALGAVATAKPGYRFIGWFYDEDLTKPITEASWVTGSLIKPQKTKDYDSTDNVVMGYEAKTYYAKFERDVYDLTINKTGSSPSDENQSFIFKVKGNALDEVTKGIDLNVVINIENGKSSGSIIIKDLPAGKYDITEVTGWSWRYSTENLYTDYELTTNDNITFDNNRGKSQWLSGDSWIQNIFNKFSN